MFSVGSPNLAILSSVIENDTGGPTIDQHIATISIGNSTLAGNTGGNVYGPNTNLGGNSPPNP